jgi:Arc/MetJ family transcription regulator
MAVCHFPSRNRRIVYNVFHCTHHSASGIPKVRTNIIIDDKLMQDTLRATGLKTKRAAVETGLRTLLRLRRQENIRRFRGKLDWQGDLDQMRVDRSAE